MLDELTGQATCGRVTGRERTAGITRRFSRGHTRQAKMKPARSNPNGVVQRSPGLASRQPWVTAQQRPSTPTGLRLGGRKTSRLGPLAATPPWGLMAPLSPLPRVVPSVQPRALLHNRVAVEAAHHLCSPEAAPGPASVPEHNESRFQRSEGSLADKPRALPWAGMNDAVGVSNRPASHFGLRTSLGLRAPPALSEFRQHRPGCGLLGFRISDFLRISGSAGRFGFPAAPA